MIAVLFLLVSAGAAVAITPPAFRLPAGVRPVRYSVDLKIPDESKTFDGSITIDLQITAATDVIWLNGTELTIRKAVLKTGPAEIEARVIEGGKDFLGFAFAEALKPARARLTIHYTAVINEASSSAVFRRPDANGKYVGTHFEPIAARRAFPCFDEPQFKVPWRLTLHVPKAQQAYSNTPVESEADESDGWKAVRFQETKPLPSYLIAFTVGPFDIVDLGAAGRNKTRLRLLTPRGDAAHTGWAKEVTLKVFERLEEYFGIPYPYEKLDQVAIPGLINAMEHPGLVTYRPSWLVQRDWELSINSKRAAAALIAHELSHQWFGNLVTLKWWNDLWLNEAFATWLSGNVMRDVFPDWNEDGIIVGGLHSALSADSMDTARRIAHPVENNGDITAAFGTVTYYKGAAVIRMFEAWMGTHTFRQRVRRYLLRHSHGNGSASDFLETLSGTANTEVAQAFSSFLHQNGAPLLSVDLQCKPGTKPVVLLAQARAVPLASKAAREATWGLPVCFGYTSNGKRLRECVLLKQPKAEVQLRTQACPEAFTANHEATGYYRVRYAGQLFDRISTSLNKLGVAEQMDFIANATAMARLRELPLAKLLTVAAAMRDSQVYDVQRFASLATTLALAAVEPEDRAKRSRFFRDTYGPLMRKLGLDPKAGDSDDVLRLRPMLLHLAVVHGKDPGLHAEAVRLARNWLRNRSSIAPDMSLAVLRSAASVGDEELFNEYTRELKKTSSREDQRRLLTALACFTDSRIASQALALFFDPAIDPNDAVLTLFAMGPVETSELRWQFVRDRLPEILQRLPPTKSKSAMYLTYAADALCSTADAEEVESLAPKLREVDGASRILARTVERIRQCAALRAASSADMKAFLERYSE
jgi:alanyl aminopeptidase